MMLSRVGSFKDSVCRLEHPRSSRSTADLSALITLLFSTTIFGWSVGEDLLVVPDHARQLIQTDHHGVIHVSFRSVGDIEHWVSAMSRIGFDLPEDLPDETFKRPGWMPE
jgi:hypothetical protein